MRTINHKQNEGNKGDKTMNTTMAKKIKWMWNGIKINGKLHRAHYSKCVLINDSEESITVYARNHGSLPQIGVDVQNNTDIMTDYFDTDRMRIRKDSQFWDPALAAFEKQESHHKAKMDKRFSNGMAVA